MYLEASELMRRVDKKKSKNFKKLYAETMIREANKLFNKKAFETAARQYETAAQWSSIELKDKNIIQEAFRLADSVDWQNEDGEPDSEKDLLECLLAGATVVRWGWKRMEKVLEDLEFPIPKAHNSKCFFRILAGAREIIAPGAHKFSEKIKEEIKEGLRKKVYEDGEEKEKEDALIQD